MNNLPKYFCVKNDGSQLFQDTVIKYLSSLSNSWNYCATYDYYGYDGNTKHGGVNYFIYPESFANNPIILSIKEFVKLSKEIDELPKKWYLHTITEEEDAIVVEYINKKYNTKISNFWPDNNKGWIYMSDSLRVNSPDNFACKDYIQITLEQFKEHVLKQKSMKKEIIGYNLIKPKYKTISEAIMNENFGQDGTLVTVSSCIEKLKEAGVLDLWFTLVYEEEEFKVGDYIVSLEDVEGSRKTGDIFKVLRLNEFAKDNIYYKEHRHGSSKEFRLATPEEIKTYEDNLLLKEAKKRYPIGTKFISVYDGVTTGEVKKSEFFWWREDHMTVNSKTDCSVYLDGKWAEILPPFPQIEINGYTAEFFNDYVRFGCAKISRILFKELYSSKAFTDEHTFGNREIESVTIGKGTFTKEQVKEIALFYLNK